MFAKKSNGKATTHVDHAKAVLPQPKRTDVEKIAATRTLTPAIQASPNWGAAVEVQTAVANLNQDANALEAKAQAAETLRTQFAAAMSDLRIARRNWKVSESHLMSTVNVFAKGSVDTVKSFALEVQTRVPTGAPVAPADLVVLRGTKAGEALVKWTRERKATKGFVVQHATDSANPATYSAIEPTTKSKYTLEGLPSGTTVYVRVAAIDPNEGRGPWSGWAAGTIG
jgi:hypothetical protein